MVQSLGIEGQNRTQNHVGAQVTHCKHEHHTGPHALAVGVQTGQLALWKMA